MNKPSLPTRAHTVLIGGLLGAAALAVAVAVPASAHKADGPASRTKPTVVLVHGAFADSSSWNGVIRKLQHDGYPVVAPANPLRGVASDAAYLASVLASVKGPVVLAGHSYGGSVISAAAAGNPKVEALVYIAAFAPDKGETALGLTGKFPGSTLGEVTNAVPFPLPGGGTGTDVSIKPDKFHHQFAADVRTSTAELMAVTQRPVAASALEEESTVAAWKTIPSWNLVTTQDLNIPPAAQRFMARRAHSHTVEIKASHAVTVSHPDAVARLVEQAARATSR